MNRGGRASHIRSIWKLPGLLVLTIVLIPSIQAAASNGSLKTEMLVTTEWLANHLQDANLVVLCIVDNGQFYSSGHIPGARMIPLTEIVTTRAGIPNELVSPSALQRAFERAGVSNQSRIILYGERSGILAARAYFTMDYLGLGDRAALLDGGFEKWRAEHREESTAAPTVQVGHLELHLRPEIVVNLGEMTQYSQSKDKQALLIDSRPNDEYTGAKLSEDVSKAGHIPHAVGLYWQDFLRKDSVPELKPEAELQALLRASGATPGKEVIIYCRTGMQSSFSYFVAKYLGYNSRMYDGSFYEWSRSSLPVEH